MKKIIAILILFISTSLYAVEDHKGTYFIMGEKNEDIKGQVSVKYPLTSPFNSGLYIAYSMKFIWDWDEKSKPIKNYQHTPEAFFMFQSKNNFLNFDTKLLDYVRFGMEHSSNGEDGDENRSTNDYFGQLQISTDLFINVGFNTKIYKNICVANENEDRDRYHGIYDFTFFVKTRKKGSLLRNEKIYVTVNYGAKGLENKVGFVQVGFEFKVLSKHFQPKFYMEYFKGYGETILNYNKKEKHFRMGFMF